MLYVGLQFADRLDSLADALQITADHVQKADAVSAHPDKLREQMADTEMSLDDLQKLMSQLDSLRTAAQDLAKQPNMDTDSIKSKCKHSYIPNLMDKCAR